MPTPRPAPSPIPSPPARRSLICAARPMWRSQRCASKNLTRSVREVGGSHSPLLVLASCAKGKKVVPSFLSALPSPLCRPKVGARGGEQESGPRVVGPRRASDLFGAPAHPAHYGHYHILGPYPRLDTRPLTPSPYLTQASRRRRQQLLSRLSRPRACSSRAAWRCGMRPNPRITHPRSSDRSACPPAALRRG